MKNYLDENKELFDRVAMRQEVWNKFMELERRNPKAVIDVVPCTFYNPFDRFSIFASFRL